MTEEKKLNIAISGLNGFIGTHLSDRFVKEGHNVAPIPRELLLNSEGLEEYFNALKPDYIFLLHSYGNMASQKNEDEIFATNIIKTYFVLKASLNVDYKALVSISSSSVYGKKSSPMQERDVLDGESMYAVSKIAAEGLVRYFAKAYNKPMVIARPFTVVGVGEQKEHLLPTLIRHAHKGTKMNLVEEASHDYVDVEDMVDGILNLSLVAHDIKGKAYNIGSGTSYTNKEVKELVEKVTGKKIKTVYVDSMREYDNVTWVADPFRMQMLGWYPQKKLEQTITEMVAFYEQTRRNPTDK